MDTEPNPSPNDVGHRALDLLVAIPETVMRSDAALRPLLQDVAGRLDVEGVFDRLGWSDANRVVIAMLMGVVNTADAAGAMRDRAQLVLTGRDTEPWADPAGVVRAFNAAAIAMEM